jgi:antitoxin MazE
MKASLIRIGNSQGVRLPRAMIAQAGLGSMIEIEVADGAIVIRPATVVREGWAEDAKACAHRDRVAAEWDAPVADFAGE